MAYAFRIPLINIRGESKTHLAAISNQVRQRNKCNKQFVKGFMLRKHSNKGMGKGCVKKAKKRSEIFHFIILAMLKG